MSDTVNESVVFFKCSDNKLKNKRGERKPIRIGSSIDFQSADEEAEFMSLLDLRLSHFIFPDTKHGPILFDDD